MEMRSPWLRETAKITILYIASGVPLVASGLLLAFLTLMGFRHWAVTPLVLGGGVLVAWRVWVLLDVAMKEKRLAAQVAVPAAIISLLPARTSTRNAAVSQVLYLATLQRVATGLSEDPTRPHTAGSFETYLLSV